MMKKTLILIGIIFVIGFICLFDFSNDVSKKINIFFAGDDTIAFENIDISVNTNNELIYEFTLKNNSEQSQNYKLYFDVQNEGTFEYVNMKVIRNVDVKYDDSLTNLSDDNVFDIANLESSGETKYKMIFKVKRINFKFIGIIKVEYNSIDGIKVN